MKKSKSRRTEQQQRAADILSMIRAAARKNYRPTGIGSKPKPVTPTEKRTVLKKLKNFLKSMHQF